MKKCSKCGEEKPLEEFYLKYKLKQQRSSQCRACIHDRYVARRDGLPWEVPQLIKRKICSACDKDKPASDFYGRAKRCRRCQDEYKQSPRDPMDAKRLRRSAELTKRYGLSIDD